MARLICAGVLALGLVGCSQKPEADLVGHWVGMDGDMEVTMDLRDNGTWSAGPIPISGAYTAKEHKATLTPERLGSKEMAERRAYLEKQFGKNSKRVKRAMAQVEAPIHVKLMGTNMLAVQPDNPDDAPFIYRRQKG